MTFFDENEFVDEFIVCVNNWANVNLNVIGMANSTQKKVERNMKLATQFELISSHTQFY